MPKCGNVAEYITKKMMNKLKNILSLFLYGIKLQVINLPFLLINFALLIYAILDIENLLNNEFWMFILLLFINVVWQVISLLYDTITLFHSTGHYMDSIDSKMDCTDSFPNSYMQYKNIEFNTNIIYDTLSNKIIRGNKPIHIIPSIRHKRQVENYINQNKGLLLLFLKAKWNHIRDGAFFNETKLCQASEYSNNGQDIVVKVSKGCYYNSFITNDIYRQQLHHQDGITLYPPLNITNTPIKSLEQSIFSNHIGVSTIVITQDGEMLILQHNNKSAVSANMYAPGASGSVDYRDWRQNKDTDLRQVIVRAMNREFYEETGIKEEFIIKTEIIGVYRNINRGGKPEYCGITYLSIGKLEVDELFKAEQKEVQNKIKYVKIFNSSKDLDLSEFNTFATKHQRLISSTLYINTLFLQKHIDLTKN